MSGALSMRILLILAALLLLFAPLQSPSHAGGLRPHKAECKGAVRAEDASFDWQNKGPVQFLASLQSDTTGQRTVFCAHEGWIRLGDIPELIALLASKTPCSSVASGFSSLIDAGSTVGHEAAYLIEGFRRGSYPPTLNSTTWRADVREIMAWWKRRRGELPPSSGGRE